MEILNTIKLGFVSTMQQGGSEKNKVKKILSTNHRKSQKIVPVSSDKSKKVVPNKKK